MSEPRLRHILGEGGWIVTGQATAVLGSLVGVRVLTELLTPETYGEVALWTTVLTLTTQVLFGPLQNGAMRFYAPAQQQGELVEFVSAVRVLTWSASCAVLVLGFMLLMGLVLAGRVGWALVGIVVTITAVVGGFNLIFSGIQNAARQRAVVALHQGAESWLRLLSTVVLVTLIGAAAGIVVLGYCISAVIILWSQYIFFRRIIPSGDTENESRRILKKKILEYSWPFAAWGIFTWAQLASDRWALDSFSTTREVGLYAVLYQVGVYPIVTLSGMVMQYMGPIFFQKVGDATDQEKNARVSKLSKQLTLSMLAVTGLLFLVTWVTHEYIFRFFVAREYAIASNLLPWLVLSSGLFAAGQSNALNLMSQLKTREQMVAKIATAIIGVVLNFVGAYWWGLGGVVAASIAFSSIYFFWMMLLVTSGKGGHVN